MLIAVKASSKLPHIKGKPKNQEDRLQDGNLPVQASGIERLGVVQK